MRRTRKSSEARREVAISPHDWHYCGGAARRFGFRQPNSRAAYVRSKAHGEALVLAEAPEAMIFRPSIVFGPEAHCAGVRALIKRYNESWAILLGSRTGEPFLAQRGAVSPSMTVAWAGAASAKKAVAEGLGKIEWEELK